MKFGQDVYEVTLPTPDGYIAVFENHSALVSIATPGVISVRHKSNEPDDMMERFATNGGVIEVLNNRVRVLADEADHADEINKAEVEKALERAKQMRKDAKDRVSIDHAQSLIDRQQVRLHVANLRRRARH
jgi:F-type H+-transporting ATPase subunit epsilon